MPLIVTNCTIVARAELFASRNNVRDSIVDGLVMGLGFAALLMAIGAFRQLVGLAWLLALLPPGAFFSLALAIAAKNHFDRKAQLSRRTASPAGARRT